MGASAVHALQRLLRLFRAKARRVRDHHLGQADDGVERRAQLVAHAGEELRLVLARLCELTALVLDLVEQPHVLDRNHGLVREGVEQFDLLVGEGRPGDRVKAERRSAFPHADGTPSRYEIGRARLSLRGRRHSPDRPCTSANVNYVAFDQGPPSVGPRSGFDGTSRSYVVVVRREAMARCDSKIAVLRRLMVRDCPPRKGGRPTRPSV